MTRIDIDCAAPDFTLTDFAGRPVNLSDYAGRAHVLLVFNRSFT